MPDNGSTLRHLTYIWEPATAVWGALTNADRHADWNLVPCVRFGGRSGATCAWGEPGHERITGRITGHRAASGQLAHTFDLSWAEEDPIEVEWSLEQQGEVTEVSVTHRLPAVAPQAKLLLSDESVGLVLARLKTLIETGDPMPWPTSDLPSFGAPSA